VFFIALYCWGSSIHDAVYAGGLAGKHGTLTVERCWTTYGTGRDHSATRMCGGIFRSDDGRTVAPDASLESDGRRGDRIQVQRDGGDHLPAGAGQVCLSIGVFFVGCLAAGLGVLAWAINRRFRAGDELSAPTSSTASRPDRVQPGAGRSAPDCRSVDPARAVAVHLLAQAGIVAA
jgi:hypothetical protein